MNRIQNELYSLVTGKYIEGKTELDLLSRSAIQHIFAKHAKKVIKDNGYPPLSVQEKRKIREYYKGCPPVSPIYHQIIKGKTGDFQPEYIPEDLYYGYIEPYYSDRMAARYIDHKCDYYRVFPGMKQPELVCMRLRGLWYGADFKPLAKKEVLRCLSDTEGEVVLKRAENSEGGAGVHFLPEKKRIESFRKRIKTIPCDVVIQKALKQHEAYACLHPQSVNTLRIMSLLGLEGVKILACCIRIGVGECRMDNSSSGGFFVGVGEDGRLGELAIFDNGRKITRHPDLGYVIAGRKLPYVDRAYDFVKRAHLCIAKFRLVSWDIALDEEGEPNLIEVNLTLGAIDDVQACTGPLFGKDTKKILKEVFGR